MEPTNLSIGQIIFCLDFKHLLTCYFGRFKPEAVTEEVRIIQRHAVSFFLRPCSQHEFDRARDEILVVVSGGLALFANEVDLDAVLWGRLLLFHSDVHLAWLETFSTLVVVSARNALRRDDINLDRRPGRACQGGHFVEGFACLEVGYGGGKQIA